MPPTTPRLQPRQRAPLFPALLQLVVVLLALASAQGASTWPSKGADEKASPSRRVRLTPPPAGLTCTQEEGFPYASHLNATALKKCAGPPRAEKVCVIGGGSSGIHMAWLLKRRGFASTVVFEARDRLGGDIWTVPGNTLGDAVTRELGAAFLSPDYVEVRALLRRFDQDEVPISVSHMMRFHTSHVEKNGSHTDTTQSAADWYADWVAEISGVTNRTKQAAMISAAVGQYIDLHHSLFGNYTSRFPPRPSSAVALEAINCTGVEFLSRYNLEILHPLMYQFFVMQGMGLLRNMSAYYMLKWVSPTSLQAGGFGNDHDTPLAMLKDGYGALVKALADDEDIDVRFGHAVRRIVRSRYGGVSLEFAAADQPDESCDLLVVSGPIPNLVRGSRDGSRPAVLDSPSEAELEVFGPMQAMQFLVSLLEFDAAGVQDNGFEALEYWPNAYQATAGVIVRRDIGYAEAGVAHSYGGLQSYSYAPYPAATNESHWKSQLQWIEDHGLQLKRIVQRYFIDTYLFHHSIADVTALKPWAIWDMQMDADTRTIYVGGSAGFETVEDSFNLNLELVDALVDSLPITSPAPALEQLLVKVPCKRATDFVRADNATWTKFLLRQPGFRRKDLLLHEDGPLGVCHFLTRIEWESRELWKSIDPTTLANVSAQFAQAFGVDPPPVVPFPLANGDGLDIRSVTGHAPAAGFPNPGTQVFEINRLTFPCVDMERFLEVDNAVWTPFLSRQPGFMQKYQLAEHRGSESIPPTLRTSSKSSSPNCSAWSHVRWASRDQWKAINVSDLIATQAKFVAAFGYAPTLERWPTADGLGVSATASPVHGMRILAVNGNDVVAYHSLKPGDRDVPGSPNYRRFFPASATLPPALLPMHPQDYEFWFASEANAQLFDADPWKYIPAFGGHCTHGIASRSDLTPDLLADGRVAFTCVNTTQWAVIDGTLYMNSCGMYADFIKDPQKDIKIARQQWTKWFGAPSKVGPINDACFQDGANWGGNPVGALIPDKCVIN